MVKLNWGSRRKQNVDLIKTCHVSSIIRVNKPMIAFMAQKKNLAKAVVKICLNCH